LKRILEVDPSCDDETIIRKAYLQKVKQYHPDAPFEDSTGDKEKFNEVQQAYEVLTVSHRHSSPSQ
jgi:molecular chaperone DnaJ